MGLHLPHEKEFLVVVMPDLFMTLNSMERWLGQIIEQNPRGRLLLVGSLGLPGTRWAEGESLDASTQTHGLSTLIWELMEQGEILSDSSSCVVFMGLGSGAHAVLDFAVSSFRDSRFKRLRDATRFLTLVNPFPLSPGTGTNCKPARKYLQTLREVLKRGVYHEQLQCLITALFSTDYLEKHGQSTTLEVFWSTRQGIELPELERSLSAPPSVQPRAYSARVQDLRHQPTTSKGAEVGIIKCIDGVLRNTSFETRRGSVDMPLLIVISTKDKLQEDASWTVNNLKTMFDLKEVDSLLELMGGNNQKSIFVHHLEAGREVLQEAHNHISQILSTALRAVQQTGPFSASSSGDENNAAININFARKIETRSDATGACDIVSVNGKWDRLPSSLTTRRDATRNCVESCEIVARESKSISSYEHSDRFERSDGSDTHREGLALETPPEPSRRHPRKKGRRAREFDKLKEKEIEQKVHRARLNRQQELDQLKKANCQKIKQLEQLQQCMIMQHEDHRSRYVEGCIRRMEEWTSSVAGAKARARELSFAKDLSERKISEDELARHRTEQHAYRVEMNRQRKLDLLEDEDEDEDESVDERGIGFDFEDDQYLDVEVVRDICKSKLGQLSSLRQRMFKTMQTELLRREQVRDFETRCRKLEFDLCEMQRVQRAYVRGDTAAIGFRKYQDINVSVTQKEVQLGTSQSVLREKREIWSLAVSGVQKLKLAINRKDVELRTALHRIREYISTLSKRAGQIPAGNEEILALKASVVSNTEKLKIRAKFLSHKQAMLEQHGDAFFDRDFRQQGVTQRVSSYIFRQDLQAEHTSLACKIKENTQEIDQFDIKLAEGLAKAQGIDLNIQTLNHISSVTGERLERLVSRKIKQDPLLLDVEKGTRLVNVSVSPKLGNQSIAETIRHKLSHQRSLEENRWVALDNLVNKESYDVLSVEEREELQLNDEYMTELQANDVTRILKLPDKIQLALPHLRSPAEIEAHKLLVTYTHGRGDAYLAQIDKCSQDNCLHVFSGAERPSKESEESFKTYVAPHDGLNIASSKSPGERKPNVLSIKQQEGNTRDLQPSNLKGRTGIVTTVWGTSTSSWSARDATQQHNRKPKEMILFDSLSDVIMKGRCSDNEEIAVRVGEKEVYRSTTNVLNSYRTRVVRFSVVDIPPTYSVDIKVTVSFKGCMDTKGFSRGRVSAVLRRGPETAGGCPSSATECIGYAPHSCQKLNLGDQFHQTPGTVFIRHCPRHIPLADFVYEVEVTAMSLTEYSLLVVVGQCELCASLVEKRLEETNKMVARLDKLGNALVVNWEALRLRERQYHVCSALIEEAESECLRCEESINDLCEKLCLRDVPVDTMVDASRSINLSSAGTLRTTASSSTSSLSISTQSDSTTTTTTDENAITIGSSTELSFQVSDKEREDTWKEIAAIETEYMHWGRLLTTRFQEKASVQESIQDLMKSRRDSKAKRERLEAQLELTVNEIPTIVSVLHGPNEAARALKGLKKRPCLRQKISLDWSPVMTPLKTLAGRTRYTFERFGWDALNLEQQQWVTLDQVVNPDQYTWLHLRKQEETKHKLEQEVKLCSKSRRNPAIARYLFERGELMRILEEPFQDLNCREKHVYRLLKKFHSTLDLVKTKSSLLEQPNKSDYLLAKRVRQTSEKDRAEIEKGFTSLDNILNPQVWNRAKQGVPGTHDDQRPPDIRSRCSGPNEGQGQSSDTREEGWEGLGSRNVENITPGFYVDIDQRLRCLQRELERIVSNDNPLMKSCVLHGAPQQYLTSALRLEVEAEINLLLRDQVQQRERKNACLIQDVSSSDEENEHNKLNKKEEHRRTRRQRRRRNRADLNTLAARKCILFNSRKTPLQREYAGRVTKLGPSGCPACMSTPCKHAPMIDVEGVNLRMVRIMDELNFARRSSLDKIESVIPLSVQKGGVTTFRRIDLINELSMEQSHLRQMLKLHLIDQELHDVNMTSRAHVECVVLHGYRTLLWTKDARVALEREHDRLVARLVATETVHGILEWMFEGWYFGEQPSRDDAVGYTPSSIKETWLTKARIYDKARNEPSTKKEERREDEGTPLTFPRRVDESRWKKSDERVAKPGGTHDRDISFSERTLRFGLLCVTIMYFRSRWLLRRKREWAKHMKRGWGIDTDLLVQALSNQDRVHASITSTQAGHQRVKVRKEEQDKLLTELAWLSSAEAKKVNAAQLLQRVYRGYIGRKAGRRWRAKRAEYKAMNSLLVSAAVTIQRATKGYSGRRRASVIRANIARWLARIVDHESRQFEAQLLSINKLEALKEGIGNIFGDVDEESLP